MKELTQDQKLFSLMTSAWSSLIIIKELSDSLNSSTNQTVHDFYIQCAKRHFNGEKKDPLNPGVVLISSYLSLVLGKQKWEEILPDVPAKNSPEEWQICKCIYNDSKKENPSLKDVIRRMRNGVSHGRIKYDIPEQPNNMSIKELLEKTMFTIEDINETRKNDTFSIEISALALWSLNVDFFNKIGLYEKNNL